uniref:Uncharacterized protein n=1 Tax=Onchocerca volvulus TaxID=6282 RepID=A0A8R1XPH0_ONCVO
MGAVDLETFLIHLLLNECIRKYDYQHLLQPSKEKYQKGLYIEGFVKQRSNQKIKCEWKESYA